LPVCPLIQNLRVVAIGPIIQLCHKEGAQADTLQFSFGTVVNRL